MELAGIEQRIDRELLRAAATLTVIADACPDPTADWVELISEHGRLLRQASHSHDAELLAVTARQTPVAGDLRLVLALIQLAHHEGLIANQFELISRQLMEIDAAVRDRQGTGEKLSSMSTLAGAQLRSCRGGVRRSRPRCGATDRP